MRDRWAQGNLLTWVQYTVIDWRFPLICGFREQGAGRR